MRQREVLKRQTVGHSGVEDGKVATGSEADEMIALRQSIIMLQKLCVRETHLKGAALCVCILGSITAQNVAAAHSSIRVMYVEVS
jgi:hypothetical protein